MGMVKNLRTCSLFVLWSANGGNGVVIASCTTPSKVTAGNCFVPWTEYLIFRKEAFVYVIKKIDGVQRSSLRICTTGYHFYDKSQAFACSTSCTMPSGLMRYRVVITFSEFIINHSPLDFSLRFLL